MKGAYPIILLLVCVSVSSGFSEGNRTGGVYPSYSLEELPTRVSNKAKEAIIARVGSEFFDNYIHFRSAMSGTISSTGETLYNMQWSIRIGESRTETCSFNIGVSESGKVFDSQTYLPDCIAYPENCQIIIDRNSAVEIARNAGFDVGIPDWGAAIRLDRETKKFYWSVLNRTITDGKQLVKVILVDAYTGEIIKHFNQSQ